MAMDVMDMLRRQSRMGYKNISSIPSGAAERFKEIAKYTSVALNKLCEEAKIEQFAVYRAKLWSDSTFTKLDVLVSDEEGRFKLLRFKYTEKMSKPYAVLEGRGLSDIIEKDKGFQYGVGAVMKYLMDSLDGVPFPVSALLIDLIDKNKQYQSVVMADSTYEVGGKDIYINGWGIFGVFTFEMFKAAKCLDDYCMELSKSWPEIGEMQGQGVA